MYDHELRRTGLQATQFALLATLARHPGSAQGQIAVWLAMEQSTLSRNLQALIRKHWVATRTASGTRVTLYEVTDTGRAALARARPGWTRAQVKVKQVLGADWAALGSLLRKLSTIAVVSS